MKNEKLIELLNEALQYEYTDVFLYPRQADMIKVKDTSREFEKFGKMELRHADNIAMQIIALGGRPNWEFDALDAKDSINEMLLDHLEREKKGIQLYNNLIEFADREGEEQLKLILKGIKAEEASHAAAIKKFIDKRK